MATTTKVYQTGNILPLIAAAKVNHGELTRVGKLVGVAIGTAEIGEQFELDVTGVYEVPKTSSTVFTAGDVAYAKTDGGVNDTNTNPMAGYVIADAANGTDVVKILLRSGA